MNEEQRSVKDTEVTAVALGWLHRFLRCDISALPAEELAEWAEWSAHEPNLEHFRRLSQTWRNLGPVLAGVPMPADADVVTDDYDGSEPVVEWLEQRSSQRKPWRLPPPGKFWAMAALIPLLVFALVRFGHQMLLREMLDDRVQAYSTGPSEHRIVELPDGSKITLGARTELSTHYTANRRVIFLDRGEAWFDVAHNPSRPFTVLAGVGAITALGTQFDVRPLRTLNTSRSQLVPVPSKLVRRERRSPSITWIRSRRARRSGRGRSWLRGSS
jgi:transmembrane sensor